MRLDRHIRLGSAMRVALCLVGSFVFATAPVFAQKAASRPLLVEVVKVKGGAQIADLGPSNFRVTLDRKPARLLSASRVRLKPRVSILLDVSASMGQAKKWNAELDLAKGTAEALRSSSNLSFILFSDHLRSLQRITCEDWFKELDSMRQAAKEFSRGRTALWDALWFAIGSQGLRAGDALVAVTDGGENDSKHSYSDVRKLLQKSGVRLFVLLLPDNLSEDHGPVVRTRLLAEISGGDFLHVGENKGIEYSEFELSANDKKAIPIFGEYVGGRILQPYLLSLDLPADVTGKLRVAAVDANGSPIKDVVTIAPLKLPLMAEPELATQ